MSKTTKNVIAVIDSGIGGLSILNQMLKNNFSDHYIYFADNKYMPYGNKDKDFIKNRILDIINYLKTEFHTKQIILACNTASTCIMNLNLEDVHILTFSKSKTYLTTKLTAENLQGYNVIADSKLASLIEKYILEEKKMDKIISTVVKKYKLNNLTSLTLGCTHFELVADKFRKYCKSTDIQVNSTNLINDLKLAQTTQKDSYLNTIKQCKKPKITLVLSKPDNQFRDKILDLIDN